MNALPRLCLALIPLAVVALLEASAATTVDASARWEMPPGWAETRGGANGRVLRVTTLAPSGRGSLGAALAARGPRVIEFAVAGDIDLAGHSIVITRPYVTIAGETAPSPGITLHNGGVNIETHDVIVRHLRIRPGTGGRAKKSGWEVDGLATGGGAHDVIVDHCSISWSTDENLSASGPRFGGVTPDEWRRNTSHRITFSHSIVAEGLRDATHRKGAHSMGTLIHDNTTQIALIGNLYLSNNARNPMFKGGARGAVVNNVIHNAGSRFIHFSLVPWEWEGHAWERGAMVIVGNVARQGASTSPGIPFLETRGPCDVHLADNLYLDPAGTPLPIRPRVRDPYLPINDGNLSGDMRAFASPMFWPPRLQARPAAETLEWVLANAGARPWDRDSVDRRLIAEARSGGGRIIDFETEVLGNRQPVSNR